MRDRRRRPFHPRWRASVLLGLVMALAVGPGALALGPGALALGPGAIHPSAHPPATGCTAWPMYQHDPARTGASTCAGREAISPTSVSSLVPRWFTPTAGPVTASPVVEAGTVFVGDDAGIFHALDATTGRQRWSFDIAANTTHVDRHAVSYGEFVSSAAYGIDPATASPTLYVGGGGSVYALDATTGRPRWATDTDPGHPTSPMEVESSPLLYQPPGVDPHTKRPWPLEVIVGNDENESPGNVPTGLLALDAGTGALLWEFAPELGHAVTTLPSVASGYGCGDVWGSPALDAADGLVVFGTGNCPDAARAAKHVSVPNEAIWAVSARDGRLAWVFSQAGTAAAKTYGGDDDFGSTPNVVPVAFNGKVFPTVLAGSKSGFVYALDARTGVRRWTTQGAQPGQTGPGAAGAIGGFIGSGAVGRAGPERNALFATSAIPAPFRGEGPTSAAGPQPDTTLTKDPARAASLHALDVATGAIVWHQPLATPSYAPVTYSNGVVFAPSTTSFAAAAYDAATGIPLWVAPLGAAPSSGVAVTGSDIFFGAGTNLGGLPPQAMGIWSFGLARGAGSGR